MKIKQVESKLLLIAINVSLFIFFQKTEAKTREQVKNEEDNSILSNNDIQLKSSDLKKSIVKRNYIKNISTESSSSSSKTDLPNKYENNNLFKLLHEEIEKQIKKQKDSAEDNSIMQKWLVDNINDLHRELKQTEVDFEHYVQVTKNILANNERQLKLQKQFSSASREAQGLTLFNVPNTIELINKQMAPPFKTLLLGIPS